MTLLGGNCGGQLPAQHHDLIGAAVEHLVRNHALRLPLPITDLTAPHTRPTEVRCHRPPEP